eukprot:gb/GEZN01010468.1/.p1 GENE.gb/GEZN01010468.1/~~gb/GEZN01010468.1/.p1  ORF type:complete len:336 (+),score=54.55 gb/GEZN01010468.1/:118-1125(+)
MSFEETETAWMEEAEGTETAGLLNEKDFNGTPNKGTNGVAINFATNEQSSGSTDTSKNVQKQPLPCCSHWSTWVAETLANFFLVLLTLGGLFISGIMELDALKMDRLLLIACIYGMSYSAFVYSFSTSQNIRHLNPAVTLALLASGKISFSVAGVHWVSQCVGCALAALCLPGIVPFKSWSREPFEQLEDVTLQQELLASCICSFVSLLVIVVTFWGSQRDQRIAAPVLGDKTEQHPWTVHELNSVLCGSVLIGNSVLTGAVSGSYMNPCFAVIISGYTKRYSVAGLVGPFVGAILTAVVLSVFSFSARRSRLARTSTSARRGRQRNRRHRQQRN